jgi:hypothetical protein
MQSKVLMYDLGHNPKAKTNRDFGSASDEDPYVNTFDVFDLRKLSKNHPEMFLTIALRESDS